MIISDLNHLEIVSQETSILGGFTQGTSANVSFRENVNINKDITSFVSVYGHGATAESDATAYGPGSLAEIFTNTNTTPYSSSASGTSISASSGYYYYPW